MADPGIGTYVRYWLHYNNLASSFYKQYSSAKKIQEDYVQQIIDSLVKSRMEKAIIQINGGHISVIDKKIPHQLSLSKVQDHLHAYFKQRGGRDETKDIMLFLNANRGFTVHRTLKQSGIPKPTVVGGNIPQLLPPNL